VTVLLLRHDSVSELSVTPARATPLGWAEPKPAALNAWKKRKP
jgi:hypothetical protein